MSDHGSLSDSLNPDAHSAVHSHQQVKPSESSNALSGGISKRLLDFKVTMAYEKSLTKEKCNLCQLYFNRNSICYKVPNHRIYSLRREWSKTKNGFDKQGRRYESASFLYQSTTVCCFCSQFFTQLPDEVPGDPNRDGGYKILNPKDTGAKLTVGTEVSRQNVALARHVYQSSNVDNKLAELAITPPYSQTSKTRREVDPWWEIDFGRYYHVHSISFDVNVGARQAWEVYVMLLDKPVGFNDPFLDHMGSFSKLHKQFNLDAQDKARTESIYWEQPEHSTCYAIRVQLRGIHALSLSRVIVLQGDDIMLSKPEDFELSTQSLASLDPFIVKTSIQESLSPGKRFELMEAHHNPMTEHHAYDKRTCVDAVQKLSLHIQSRYENLEKWRALVLEHSQIFPDSEILMLHRIVFKYASDLFPHNKGRPLSEHELMTSGLIAHYPRCDLMEVHQRVRSVIRWIQTRTHMKVLGALLDSVPLNAIANAPSDQLYHLMSAFKRAEYYWNKRDQQELLHGSLNGSTRASQVVHSTMDEIRGCSWSQFLLIMGLFCKQQCELIPEKVFHIEHSHAMRRQSEVMPEELYSLNGSADGRSVSSYSLSTIMPQKSLQQQQQRKIQTAIDRSRSRGNLRHALGSDAPNGSTLNAPSVLSSSTSLLSSTFKTINDKKQTKSILDTVRESGPYPFDSSFSEYKFGHFKKKLQRTDIAFPKSLSLDFARGLIPTRSAILAFENQELILGGNLENNSLTNTAQDDNASKGSGQSAMTGIGSFDLPSVPLGASRPNTRLSALRATRSSFHSTADSHDNKSSTAPPALAAAKTAKSFFGTSMRNFDEPLSSPKLSRAATAKSEFKGIQLSKSLTNSTVLSSPSKKRSTSQEDQELEDWINSPDDNAHKEVSKELNAIDFHRVCALCELRLPRSAVEIKVLRKHIVKLRTAWDPALVSKEVRSLDNTISMYNLVYVCLFCAQFFDPDFPDGIAYPNRVPATTSTGSKILDSIGSEKAQATKSMVPFYDIRYRSNDIEVGDIFDQPDTQESRQRALRAREVASHIAEKMREIQERSLVSDTSEERVLNPLKMPKTPKTPNTFNHMGSCNSVLNNTM